MTKKNDCAHMDKAAYLKNADVNCFVKHLASLTGDACFTHEYAKGGKRKVPPNWQCDSLKSAAEKYLWKKENFACNNKNLVELSRRLECAINKPDAKEVLRICLEILKWGGVNNGAYAIAKLYVDDKLICNLHGGLAALTPCEDVTPDLSDFKPGGYIMNASFTKIYSLLSNKPFIIYDSRVAAALGMIVKRYWQKKNPSKQLPDCLSFGWLLGREAAPGRGAANRRCADKGMFKKIPDDQTHALWNMRANWIAESALRCAYPNEQNIIPKMRELEAALFMIGYDVTDPPSSASPSAQVFAPE